MKSELAQAFNGLYINAMPNVRDTEWKTLWREYEPRVKVTATQYVRNALGLSLEELVDDARYVLLHAIRTHDVSRGQFSTHFYTLLKNHYRNLLIRNGVSKRYLVCIPFLRKKISVYGERKAEILANEWRDKGYEAIIKEASCNRRHMVMEPIRNDSSVAQVISDATDHFEFILPKYYHEPYLVDGDESIESIVGKAIHNRRLKSLVMLRCQGYSVDEIADHMTRGVIEEYKDMAQRLVELKLQRDLARIKMLLSTFFTAQERMS